MCDQRQILVVVCIMMQIQEFLNGILPLWGRNFRNFADNLRSCQRILNEFFKDWMCH